MRATTGHDPERPPVLGGPSRRANAPHDRGGEGSIAGRLVIEALSSTLGLMIGTVVGIPFLGGLVACFDCRRTPMASFGLGLGYITTVSLATAGMVTLAGNLVFDQPGSYWASLLGAFVFGLLPAPMLFIYPRTRDEAGAGLALIGGAFGAPLGAVVGYEAGLYQRRSAPPEVGARPRRHLARPQVRLLPWLRRDAERGTLAGGVGLTGRW